MLHTIPGEGVGVEGVGGGGGEGYDESCDSHLLFL